jgi:hypothetical protein
MLRECGGDNTLPLPSQERIGQRIELSPRSRPWVIGSSSNALEGNRATFHESPRAHHPPATCLRRIAGAIMAGHQFREDCY